jgi:hypothetical protein
VDRALAILDGLGVKGMPLGHAVADPERAVRLPNGLVGRGNAFLHA